MIESIDGVQGINFTIHKPMLINRRSVADKKISMSESLSSGDAIKQDPLELILSEAGSRVKKRQLRS